MGSGDISSAAAVAAEGGGVAFGQVQTVELERGKMVDFSMLLILLGLWNKREQKSCQHQHRIRGEVTAKMHCMLSFIMSARKRESLV